MTQKQERFRQTEITFTLGKNGAYMPSSSGGRSISVGRRVGRQAGKFHDSTTAIQ